MSDKPPKIRYDGIQVLRFLAAGMVLFTHATFYTKERLDPSITVWKPGEAGVDIFFVISGFVMIIASAKKTGGWVDWRNFFVRRIIRVVPMYWLATTLNVMILLLLPKLVLHSSLNFWEIFNSYFLIPDFNADGRVEPLVGVGWTLYFESLFYVLFTMGLLFSSKNPVGFVAAALTFLSIGAIFRQESWPAICTYFNPIVLEFLIGMLIALYVRGLRVPWFVGAALIIGGILEIALLDGSSNYWVKTAVRGIGATGIVSGFVLIEPYIEWKRFGFLLFMGNASYILYLFHPMVAPAAPVFMKKFGIISGWLSVGLGVSMAMAFAAITHHFVEAPFIKFLVDKLPDFEKVRIARPIPEGQTQAPLP